MAISVSSSNGFLIKRLDHLGLVAGMCKELGIADLIDTIIPKTNHHKVSHGQAFIAMLINGLGFHSRTLHMMTDFFKDKPTERLIAPDILPEHINDDVLGRCLDALYEADVSLLYQIMAEKVVQKLKLKSNALHIDITSFHVDGDYHDDGDDIKRLQLVRGYSRDHRPELNQVILELICENQAGIPVYMQAMNGNTNDQKAFAEFTRHHIKSLKSAQESRYMVGDAALYTKETIQSLNDKNLLFVTRVPMKLKESKHLIKSLDCDKFTPMNDGYQGYWMHSNYAGVKQKWLIVRSEKATKREEATFNKNLKKNGEKEAKAFDKLCKKRFACQKDAQKALDDFRTKLTVIDITEASCNKLSIYSSAGRPRQNKEPDKADDFLRDG